jgi:hypothetical protein
MIKDSVILMFVVLVIIIALMISAIPTAKQLGDRVLDPVKKSQKVGL